MVNNSKRELVEENIENIKKWLSEGVTMASISKTLGIAKETLYKHLKGITGGLEIIKTSRKPAVELLENTMFMAACGYEKKIKKHIKVKRCRYENGKKAEEWEELVEYDENIYYPPDTTAGIFLLKNWGGYMNEPKAMKIREKEAALKEKKANVW